MSLVISTSEVPSFRLPSWIKLKSFSPSTTFLVSSSAMDPHYRKAVSLGIPILHPSFLHACTELNNESEAREEARNHILPRFSGLSVYFHGPFDGRLPIIVGEHGGAIAQSASSATHIIVAPDGEPIQPTNKQLVVTAAWIRESMDLGWMANEANFEMRPKGNRLRRRSAKMIPRKFSRKADQTPLDIAGALKYKRYQLCRELYMSEINCLKAIDFLIRISTEENFLSPEQSDVIFGSFHEQKKVHSELVARLGKVLDGWNDYSQIGSIFVELAIQMEDAYAPYFQGLTAALELFKECKAKNAKFRHYIKEKEKDRSIDKQKIEYLLNNPMQQLTSRVGVTLKDILSKTDISLVDHVLIKSAIDVVDDVLKKCNNFKKESSESELIYRQVKNIPARILCSSRRFFSRCRFICLKSPTLNLIVPVELLLFEDVLMITRRNHEAQVSCATLGQRSRRAKFVDVYHMSGIREIQLFSRAGEPPLVELTLRRPQGDSEWHLEINQEFEETMKFLNQIVDQVEKVSSRNIFIRTIYSSFCPKTPDAALKITPSGFVRSLSSSSAVKSIRSYSQRLRLRRNVSADVAISRSDGLQAETASFTPKRPPLPMTQRVTPSRVAETPKEVEQYTDNRVTELFNERSVDVPPPRPQTPPRGVQSSWNSTPVIQEVDSEEELVNPYESVRYFSPLKNLNNHRYPSIMDKCC